ncbi:MAG: type II toxin-antitoxin system VapC family toxin [Terriglobia bacterium]
MRAIDTNVLVRLIVRDDSRQTAAAEEFVAQGAWVSVVVLAEAVWGLGSVYELDREGQARAIEMLLNHQNLVLQDTESVAAALQFLLAEPAPGFSDCLILQLARKAGNLLLGTFDKHLSKAAGTQLL